LRIIGCGGAKLEAELAWNLEGLGWTVLTGYGLTETSPVITFNEHRRMKLGTEGRPLAGVEVTIAGEPGKPGEILVRGPNVFAGYWHNSEATANAFTADGRFRTGDVGELDADGFLRIVGRSKELIVLPDGKKIVPETLEKVYAASPLVREIAIFELDGRIVALVVPNDDVVRERGAVRAETLFRETLGDIATGLPGYQRLADYRITRTPLPRTQLGKLKRHLLPELYRNAATGERHAGEAAPLDEADAALVQEAERRGVWQWLKERHPDHTITLDTSPQLDLKIDSLGWLTLTLEIEQRFGVALTGDAVSRILSVRDLLREIAAAPPAETKSRPAAFAQPGAAARAFGAVIHAVMRPLVRLAFRLRVDGLGRLPATGPLVFTPNHTSYLDPFVVAAALPWKRLRDTYWAGWVGIMFKGPLTRLASRATQVFPVDPDRDLAGAVETARTLLRNGNSVVWFPEGRRSPDGTLETFQAGVALLLRDGTVQAVPVAIRGAYELWPRGRRVPRFGPVHVTFGEPLEFPANGANGGSGASEREGAEQTRTALENAVRSLLAEGEPK
jgi:long-chain acyl-CoA synthetase